MVAIGLADDKVEFLLTVDGGKSKDWPKLMKVILDEYPSDPASSEQAFLSRMREPSESFLVILLFWSDCIVRCLASRRVQHSMRRHRKRFLASFFEGFLSPHLQNYN